MLPETLARSMSAGIGLFLAFIGYQSGEGIGVVTADGSTLVNLGASHAMIGFPTVTLQPANVEKGP